ncbi:MAG TPA: hypothetical protein H9998_01695, partial [Candidatus Ruthenibacterium merdipullorum]|nr:hypothetical protein [Candidatus Ruthenibacterium merdipullorum]
KQTPPKADGGTFPCSATLISASEVRSSFAAAHGSKSSSGTFEQTARSRSDGGSTFCRQGPARQFWVNSSVKKAR